MDDTTSTELIAFDLFEELGKVFEHLCAGGSAANLEPKSSAASKFMSHCLGGRPPVEALYLLCQEHDVRLCSLLFGYVRPNYDDRAQELTASDHGKRLQIILPTLGAPFKTSTVCAPNTIILLTDFKSFSLYRTDEGGSDLKPFAVFNAREICEEIAFTGSVWAIAYPAHHAIVTRTISYTFPQNAAGALFSSKPSASDDMLYEESAAYDRLCCLNLYPVTKLLSLEALRVRMASCSRAPKLLSEHKEGDYTLRRYSPQRSLLFDFGGPASELSRGDVVTTYNAGHEEFHRDFFILPPEWESQDQELQLAAFDILHTLAIRRAKLFRTGFASRVYNVLLPPVLLTGESEPSNAYALFPCLNLYRTQRRGFRRTLSVTFIACPMQLSDRKDKHSQIVSRAALLEEIYRLKDDLLSPIVYPAGLRSMRLFTISGPITSYIRLSANSTIPELLRDISKGVLQRILSRRYVPDPSAVENLVNRIMFPSNMESRIATISLQVDWTPPEGFKQPWERWLATGNDRVFCNSLFRTLFYWDFLDPYSADASSYALQFKQFNVGDTLGADMGGMTLFNPQDSLKFVLYPRAREKYPDFSIVRWMTWQVYIDSALASLRALIYKFHPIFESKGDMHSIIDTLDEMIQEFVDFYDLEIRDYFYRKEYEKIRTLMQVDSDYAQLQTKFASYKEEESLREQRLINKLILSLTIATVTISVVSTVAQMGGLSKVNYLLISLSLSTVLVWIGYKFFDPFRRAYKRLWQAISRSFEV